jgi:hypothetical protein
VELTLPAGCERLLAVWLRAPLSLAELLGTGADLGSPGYRSTRSLERLQETLRRLPGQDLEAVVLAVSHRR